MDSKKIARNFDRFSGVYDKYALLQKDISDYLKQQIFDRIDTFVPKFIYDLGCGTGMLTGKLAKNYPKSEVIGIDFSGGMVRAARAAYHAANLRFECADIASFNYLPGSMLVSSCCLHWLGGDLLKFLHFCSGFTCVFAIIIEPSLSDIKASLAAFGINSIMDFPVAEDIITLVKPSYFEVKKFQYRSNLFDSLKAIKSIGAGYGSAKAEMSNLRKALANNPEVEFEYAVLFIQFGKT